MKFFLIGLSLIVIGTVIVAVAALVYGLASSLGLIVLIGPIPIVLGAGEYSFLAIIFRGHPYNHKHSTLLDRAETESGQDHTSR